MQILGKIRHRIILLLFEYMSNGNLFETLHRNIKDEKIAWDWNHRYKIALVGICYLHHDCSPPVIHSSILLDEDYEAKVAYFGVARFAEKSQMGYSFFAGLHGYIAPDSNPYIKEIPNGRLCNRIYYTRSDVRHRVLIRCSKMDDFVNCAIS